MSNRHYSSSAPVQWLRKNIFKIEKPYSLGWGEWEKWENDLRKTKPVGYFFTEVLPDWLEWFPRHSIDYIDAVRYFIVNWYNGSHRLNSTLEIGAYHEISERMLFSMFDTFVDFIECETASHHINFASDDTRKKYKVPLRRRIRLLRWGKFWRCPEAGIDHIKWEMTLDIPDPTDPNWSASPAQAAAAREKMALYTWWKHVRPKRGGSWEATGFRKFWDEMDAKYGKDSVSRGGWLGLGGKSKMTAAETATYNRLSKAADALEEQWKEEDTQMLIRLIKLRESLWT